MTSGKVGEGDGTPLQHSCLENPMDGGAWWAAVHGVTKSRTRLSDFTFTFHFHALEKEMAIHSSVLTWRIPGAGEPGGLLSTGSHRVGHDWSDLAAAGKIWKVQATMPHWEAQWVWGSFLFLEHLCITSPNAMSTHYFRTKTLKKEKNVHFLLFIHTFIHSFITQNLLNPDWTMK